METAIAYHNDTAFASSDERKMIRRLYKLKEEHPNDVTVIREPENNDGCIYCKFPSNWVQIRPPKKLNLTDDERRLRAERMQKARESIENEEKTDGE